MKLWSTGIAVMPAALLLLPLCSCGPPPFVESPDEAVDSPSDQVAVVRTALAQLSTSRFADGAVVDLALAERWLARVEDAIREGDEDDDEARLALRAARAQLAAVKAYYARREAETVLEDVRGEYERERMGIRALEDETLRLLESPEDLP